MQDAALGVPSTGAAAAETATASETSLRLDLNVQPHLNIQLQLHLKLHLQSAVTTSDGPFRPNGLIGLRGTVGVPSFGSEPIGTDFFEEVSIAGDAYSNKRFNHQSLDSNRIQ